MQTVRIRSTLKVKHNCERNYRVCPGIPILPHCEGEKSGKKPYGPVLTSIPLYEKRAVRSKAKTFRNNYRRSEKLLNVIARSGFEHHFPSMGPS